MKNLITIFFLSLVVTFSTAQTMYFPPSSGNVWQNATPTSLGWCTSEIDSFYTYLNQSNSKAFIVLKDGKIVMEKYFGTFTQDSIWYWASAGKSLTSTLIGIAQQEKLVNINDLSSKYLGVGWTTAPLAKENLINIRHQLTMTTGLDDSVNKDCTLPSCLIYKADAGTRWAYHNAPYTILDKVIEKASGISLNQFNNSRLRNKIGMNGLFVTVGDNNVYFSSPRSMARYGLLMLNKGTWNTTKILDDATYFMDATNTSQQLNKAYGYLWWLNGKASFMVPTLQVVLQGNLVPNAPADMFSALGKNGQIINIVPSQNLVVVRMGNSDGSPVPITYVNEIWKRLNKIICKPTATADLESTQFELFPNPSSDVITIQSDTQATDIQVFNELGQAMQVVVNDRTLHIQHLPKGIYFLKIGNMAKRFVKM